MNENKEVCELADITVSRVVEQLGDPKLLASKLVSTLGELTKQDSAEEDIGFEGAKYHATRLALELDNAKNDSDKDRRYINRIWKDLVEAFEVIQPSIENDARKAEYRKILKPRKTDPKTGRVEFYFEEIELEASVLDDEKQTVAKDGKPVIHYEHVKSPKASFWGTRFSHTLLTKWRYRVWFTLVPLILAGSLYIGGVKAYRSNDSLIHSVYIAVLLYFLIWVIRFLPFYRIAYRRVVQAPTWMMEDPSLDGVVLELRLSDRKDKHGDNLALIDLAVYRSKCLVCGRNVIVQNGVYGYRHRLIGKCLGNPREHIYSFDHMTQKGVPLRSDTYLG